MKKDYKWYGTDTAEKEEDCRLIGVVDGVVKVERLDTDTDDYYKGYVDGLRAAYEVYYLKKERNCPVSSHCSCDRSAPCSDCDMLDEDAKTAPSDDYKKGYEDGYFKGECGFFEQFEDDVETPAEEDDLFKAYDQGYTEGLVEGREIGFNDGYDAGYKEAQSYNVILDGELLDQIYDFKEEILSYRKEPWRENREHNDMIFELHRGLIELTENWVMNQVWDYWYKREEELKN